MEDSEDYGDYEACDFEDNFSESEKVEVIKLNQESMVIEKKASTFFVTIDDIKNLIAKKIRDITELIGLSDDEARILYQYFKWRKDRLDSEWFGQEDEIRIKAGIDPRDPVAENKDSIITCPMCFENKPRDQFSAQKCNHYICKDCIRDYINYEVTKPENGFYWKCPTDGCNIVLLHSFNLSYLTPDKERAYYKKMAIAYADNSKSLRWCPGTDCHYGVEVESIVAKSIQCPCGFVYCFKCGTEDHLPCDCETAKEWIKKDESGGANAKWLLSYTKECPKCRRPIEKNQGCNYMKCRHPGCGQEFCWLCLSDWKTHNDHFKCNKFDKLSKTEKDKMEDDKQKERTELQQYAFFYERYQNNNLAIKSVKQILADIKANEKSLAHHLGLSLIQLDFLQDACTVLRNSKRVLKWSYAYGYYLKNDLQKNLYAIIQEKLDMYSSELHVLLEKDYSESTKDISLFTRFKEKVLAAVFKCKQVISPQNFLQLEYSNIFRKNGRQEKFFRIMKLQSLKINYWKMRLKKRKWQIKFKVNFHLQAKQYQVRLLQWE